MATGETAGHTGSARGVGYGMTCIIIEFVNAAPFNKSGGSKAFFTCRKAPDGVCWQSFPECQAMSDIL